MSEWYSKYTSLELLILNFSCVHGWIGREVGTLEDPDEGNILPRE